MQLSSVMLQLLANDLVFVSVVWVSFLELRTGLLNHSLSCYCILVF